jgi:hypothetical protein
MMRAWTNMTWPDDPYRTGQQLHRRPAPRLAAFTSWPRLVRGDRLAPAAAAIVYLPLRRTGVVTVTGQTLAFGFRAAAVDDDADRAEVAAVADLDLMQARRHAAVLAGYLLADDLAALRRADGTTAWRGLAAVAGDWALRGPAAGRAALLDCGLDLPGSPPLAQARQQSGLTLVEADTARHGSWDPAALAVERALAIALLCARHLGHYDWSGTLDTAAVMAATTWDCLPWPETATPAKHTASGASAPGGADAVMAASLWPRA